MPLPVAHALFGASVAAVLSQPSRSRRWKLLLAGGLLGICPDFDYALNWLRISGGGWHHGFSHSIFFGLIVGLIMATLMGDRKARSVAVYGAASLSHTLLDFMITESQGVALWWPFTDRRYKLRMSNPIDYTWSDAALSDMAVDILRISFTELIIFGPILLAAVLIKKLLVERGVTA